MLCKVGVSTGNRRGPFPGSLRLPCFHPHNQKVIDAPAFYTPWPLHLYSQYTTVVQACSKQDAEFDELTYYTCISGKNR